jgi:predicted O-methyltransferase YrrM
MKTIQAQFEYLKSQPSDINEHLQTLHDLASECDHVTEFGVRTALSTTALLAGLKPDAKLISYDLERTQEVEDLFKQCMIEEKDRCFRIADTREVEIDMTDLLFIDTWHVYDCLINELKRSAPKVRKYIAFHDTTTFAEK